VNIKSLAGSVATLANWLTSSVITMSANLLLNWSSGGNSISVFSLSHTHTKAFLLVPWYSDSIWQSSHLKLIQLEREVMTQISPDLNSMKMKPYWPILTYLWSVPNDPILQLQICSLWILVNLKLDVIWPELPKNWNLRWTFSKWPTCVLLHLLIC
jgi:hypothetical protein